MSHVRLGTDHKYNDFSARISQLVFNILSMKGSEAGLKVDKKRAYITLISIRI
jgi:hypothetical protein